MTGVYYHTRPLQTYFLITYRLKRKSNGICLFITAVLEIEPRVLCTLEQVLHH
jgi:hypothetical protein